MRHRTQRKTSVNRNVSDRHRYETRLGEALALSQELEPIGDLAIAEQAQDMLSAKKVGAFEPGRATEHLNAVGLVNVLGPTQRDRVSDDFGNVVERLARAEIGSLSSN